MKTATYTYPITLQDVDFSRRLKMTRLIWYLLETAGRNAAENHFGMQQVNTKNHTWVLSRIAVEMNEFPEGDKTIAIETWVENVGRLFTTRNFCIRDEKGNVIGSATSIWAMIDIETRRAVDLTSHCASFVVEKPSLCERPQKIPSIQTEPLTEYKVKYSDIDLNYHANSAKYVEWLLDTIDNPAVFFKDNRIARFELQYINEALLDDVLTFYKENTSGHEMLFEIRRNTDSICKMRLIF